MPRLWGPWATVPKPRMHGHSQPGLCVRSKPAFQWLTENTGGDVPLRFKGGWEIVSVSLLLGRTQIW